MKPLIAIMHRCWSFSQGIKPLRRATAPRFLATAIGFLLWVTMLNAVAGPGTILRIIPLPSRTVAVGPAYEASGILYTLSDLSAGMVTLSALDIEGNVVWVLQLPDRRTYDLAEHKPAVVRGSDGNLTVKLWGGIARVSVQGKLLWSRSLPGASRSLPVVAPDGSIVVAYGNGSSEIEANGILRLDASGRTVWKRSSIAENLWLTDQGEIATLYYGSLTTLGPDGHLLWGPVSGLDSYQTLLTTAGDWLMTGGAGLPSALLVSKLGSASLLGRLSSLSSARAVEFPTGRFGIPTIQGTLIGMDRSGTVPWTAKLGIGPCSGVSLDQSGNAIVLGEAGWLASVNESGNVLWTSPLPSSGFVGSPYLLSKDGSIVCATSSSLLLIQGTGVGPAASLGFGGNQSAQLQIVPPNAAPTDFQSTNAAVGSYIELHWSSVANATAYEVWRSATTNLDEALPWPNATVQPLTFTDATADIRTNHYYWVRATNSGGVGPFSSPIPAKLTQTLAGEIAWSYSHNGTKPISATVADDGTVALFFEDGTLVLMDGDGHPIGTPFTPPPDSLNPQGLFQCQSKDGRIVLCLSEGGGSALNPTKGRLVALDRGGAFLWQTPLPSVAKLPPAITVAGDLLLPLGPVIENFILQQPEGISAFDSQGNRKWHFVVPGGLLTSPVALADSSALFQGADGVLYQVDSSGYLSRSLRLSNPGPGSGHLSISDSGLIWIPTGNGFQILNPDFSLGRANANLGNGLDEAMGTKAGIPVLGVFPDSVFRTKPDGNLAARINLAPGLLDAATDLESVIVRTESGLREATLNGVNLRILNAPSPRVTAVTLAPSGVAIFGTADGNWWATKTSGRGVPATQWGQRSHDARLSASLSEPPPLPGAPAGLSFTTNSILGTTQLRWTSSSFSTEYWIFRQAPGDPDSGRLLSSNVWGSTSFTDFGGVLGATNRFWVVGHNSSGTGAPSAVVTRVIPAPPAGALVRERADLGDQVTALPALGSDGTLYLSMRRTNSPAALNEIGVAALDSQSLALRWFSPGALAGGSTPMVNSRDELLLIRADGRVVKLDREGTTVWSIRLRGSPVGQAAIDEQDNLYVLSYTTGLWVVSSMDSTGHLRWESSTRSANQAFDKLWITGGGLLILSKDQPALPVSPRALDLNGDWIWPTSATVPPLVPIALDDLGRVLGFNGNQFVQLREDATTDSPIEWPFNAGALVVTPSGLRCATSQRTTVELLGSDGIPVTLASGGPIGSLVVGKDEVLYASTANGSIQAFTTQGQTLWKRVLQGNPSGTLTLSEQGLLYFVTPEGRVSVLQGSAGSPQSGWPGPAGGPKRQSRAKSHLTTQPSTGPTVTASYGTFQDGIHLEWSAVPGAYAYDVLRSDTPILDDAQTLARSAGLGGFVDTSAPPDVTYHYWIRARNREWSILSPSPAEGVRRQLVAGDDLKEWRMEQGPGSMALTPQGLLRVLGSSNLYLFDRALNLSRVNPHGYSAIPPLVIAPSGTMAFRAAEDGATNRLVLLDPNGSPRSVWSTTSAWITEPAIGRDDQLYLATSAGEIVRLNGSNAAPVWTRVCGAPLYPPSISATGIILVSTRENGLLGYSSAGDLLWQAPIQATRSVAFDISGHALVISTNSSGTYLHGIDSHLGKVAWSVPLWDSSAIPIASTLVLDDNRIRIHEGGFFSMGYEGSVVTPSWESGAETAAVTSRVSNGRFSALLTRDGGSVDFGSDTARFVDRQLQPDASFRAVIGDTGSDSLLPLLDDSGRFISHRPGTPLLIGAGFSGATLGDTAWPIARGDQQRSGRAPREVRVEFGEPSTSRPLRTWPIRIEAAARSASIQRLEIRVDGQTVWSTNAASLNLSWSGDPLRPHELQVTSLDSNGIYHIDGPWRFSDARPQLTLEGGSGAPVLVAWPAVAPESLLLEWSRNLSTWSAVETTAEVLDGSKRWRITEAQSLGPAFFRVVLKP